jgi:hypothetical protein
MVKSFQPASAQLGLPSERSIRAGCGRETLILGEMLLRSMGYVPLVTEL